MAVHELTGGKDYDVWYKSIQTAFRAQKISYLLQTTKDSSTNHKDEDEDEVLGLMIITNSLSDTGQRYIIECNTVLDAVEKLKPLYLKEDTLLSLGRELDILKWKSQKVEVFINDLNNIKLRLQKLDKSINDDRFVSKILNELLNSLDYIRNNYEIDDMMDKKIDYDKLQTTVIKAHNREQIKQKESNRSQHSKIVNIVNTINLLKI